MKPAIHQPSGLKPLKTSNVAVSHRSQYPCPLLGTGIVSAPVPKKLLIIASIDDCYTSARGCTATLGNFAKATFAFDAISKIYSHLTPDLWKETVFSKSPYQEFTDHLVKTHTRVSVQRTQAPAVPTT
ncbi:hypothetical protein A6R68_08859 [Neotoma lepida]|uniref:Small ribosomal subunit protein uS5 n=1 Tax=Neotoma lepida TaxID=56216 RepID=A0A1A6G1D7_NEOLE|nr:hypothetical protein A6R68_08859 [Neotoma lepida]